VTEICLSERREAELSSCGLIPLVHRKNSDVAAFLSAQSLQKPQAYEDADATMNANLSARLPYLFACCRFAHYLKCMVRDKIGSTLTRVQLERWLSDWLIAYVDGSPDTSSEEFKAQHPLADAQVRLTDREDAPGVYEARFFLRPHYQLEGLSVALRLLSRLPSQ
jgi:type VI secretion system protein ImpC